MNVKEILLKQLLSSKGISSGYTFRTKINDHPEGELKVIQLKDLVHNYTAIGNNCYKVPAEGIKAKYILNYGDIVFISKGQNNNAIAFSDTSYKGKYIASSALFVISVDLNKANPNYIAWYINQLPVQNYINQNLTGTYTPTVNRKVVENIPLKLPSLDVQYKMATLGSLAIKEKEIQTQIRDLKFNLVNHQLLQSFQNK